jgi:hypothetical protein
MGSILTIIEAVYVVKMFDLIILLENVHEDGNSSALSHSLRIGAAFLRAEPRP